MSLTPIESGSQFQSSRRRLGLIAVVFLVVSGLALVSGNWNTGWAASSFRIGVVLGALWLALPRSGRIRNRPIPIQSLIVVAGLVALLLPRLKYVLPLLLAGLAAGWLLRPKRRR